MYRVFILFFLSTFSVMAQKASPVATTLTPVTQDRDKAIYDWQKRHLAVMEMGKTAPADVVMLGDSIWHYWAGEPKAPIVRGQKPWDELFQGKTVANLGFGWDRIENALWRVNQGELSALKPKTLILLIGTNNLEFNTALDIRAGLVNLCQTIHKQVPECHIQVLGLLPRTLPEKLISRPVEVNAELHQALAGMERVHFHDLSKVFYDEEGKLDAKLFSDGLHPNEEGYTRLAKAMRLLVAH
jgi:lysophospholipase L1-like esterase